MKNNLYDLRIKTLQIQDYNILTIILTDNSAHTADLGAEFTQLFCYPKNLNEWRAAKINEGAFAIEWESGFDIHFDQIMAIALKNKAAS